MEKFFITKHHGDDKWKIPVCYFEGGSNARSALVFVGGWGDRKEIFNGIVSKLTEKSYPSSIVTFSFRGYEEEQNYPASLQIVELVAVLQFLIKKKKIKNVKLFVTSMGAYSACYALADSGLAGMIATVLFFDPADYYLGEESDNTWAGYQEFQPNKPTLSSLLSENHANCTINVVHLTLRNHSEKGYISDNFRDRARGDRSFFPRLNTAMVRNFYEYIPKKNRGKYIEIDTIPHAFVRDGNVEENEKGITNLIKKLL